MSYSYEVFSNVVGSMQSKLELYIPDVPKDAVKGILRSFACSFAVSTLISGGNPVAGLSGGALAVLATTVHIASMTGIKNLQTYLCHRFNRPIESISFEGWHCAFLLSWGSTLYLGNALGLAINNKASFYATIPFILWKGIFEPTETPIMGIIVS